MEDRTFSTAVWAESWEDIHNNAPSCEQGVASFSKDDGAILEIPFGELLSSSAAFLEGEDKLPKSEGCLYGFTREGARLVLENARLVGMQQSLPGGVTQRIRGSHILVGKCDIDPGEKVAEVELSIKGLREWLGRSPITIEIAEGEAMDSGEAFSVVVGREGAEPCGGVLRDASDCRVLLENAAGLRGNPMVGVTVEHRCTAHISLKAPLDIDGARGVALAVAKALSLCFGFDAEIGKLVMVSEGTGKRFEHIAPYAPGLAPKQPQRHSMPLPCSRIPESELDSLLSSFLDKESPIGDSVSLLSSLMFKKWVLPEDLRFIAASQLFEALSKVGVDQRSICDDEVFEKYKEAAKKALESIGDKAITQWFMSRLPGNKKGQTRLQSELLARHEDIVRGFLGMDPSVFVDRHTALRNRLVHRQESTSRVDYGELHRHTEVLLLLCYCIGFELAGVSAKTVVEGVSESGFRSYARDWAREMYGLEKAPEDG